MRLPSWVKRGLVSASVVLVSWVILPVVLSRVIEIAGAGIDHEALVFGGFAERGRQQLDLFVGEFAQATAVAVDGVGVHGRDFLVGVALPLEEDAAAVVRPADGGGFVADEGGSAHDVVDGQGEVVRRTGLEDKENDEGGEGYCTHSGK